MIIKDTMYKKTTSTNHIYSIIDNILSVDIHIRLKDVLTIFNGKLLFFFFLQKFTVYATSEHLAGGIDRPHAQNGEENRERESSDVQFIEKRKPSRS